MNPKFHFAFIVLVALSFPATSTIADTHLYVKFFDDTPVLTNPAGRLFAIGENQLDLRALNTIANGRWSSVHEVSRDRLRELRSVGEQRSGRALPDLSTEFFLHIRGDWTALKAEVSSLLDAHPLVEYWETTSLEVVAPPTPDFVSSQTYLNGPPGGIGVGAIGSYNGASVTVGVIENGFYSGHADIPASIPLLHGINTSTSSWQQHGTASIGVIAAVNNGWGTTGIAPGATIKFFATTNSQGYNPASAISSATSVLNVGDVLMVNAQQNDGSGNYVPVEFFASEFNAVKTAVANGIIVVIAGANGNVNLNTSSGYGYSRDSGAIYVGAGASPASANPRSRLAFSNYGNRFNVQAWGEHVFTTGYGYDIGAAPFGTAYSSEGITRYYIGSYGGTSSATPIVAGVIALLQSAHKGAFLGPATPAAMRQALIASGAAQNPAVSGHIGPQVSVQGAWYYFTVSPPSLTVNDHWCLGDGDAYWSTVSGAGYYQLLGVWSEGSQLYYHGSGTSTFFNVGGVTKWFQVRACKAVAGEGCTKWSATQGPVIAHQMCH